MPGMVAILRYPGARVTRPEFRPSMDAIMLTALPAFSDNYIWLRDTGAGTIVVDPGEAGPVIAAADAGVVLGALLLTHHHADHIGGVAQLREEYRLPCYGPHDPRIPDPVERVGDGDRIVVCGQHYEVIEVPGHTRTHIAFHGEGVLFCGDTLFSLGCGRLFEGTPAQMRASLGRLAALADDTQVCCAHEYTRSNAAFALAVDPDNPALQARAAEVDRLREHGRITLPSTIASERACNPFLRVNTPSVRAAVQRRLGHPPQGDDQAFAALRAWKDEFRA